MTLQLKQAQGFLTSGCFDTEFSEHDLCGNRCGWAGGGGEKSCEEVVGEHRNVEDSMLEQSKIHLPQHPVVGPVPPNNSQTEASGSLLTGNAGGGRLLWFVLSL